MVRDVSLSLTWVRTNIAVLGSEKWEKGFKRVYRESPRVFPGLR